jgi:hypothetical protein
MPIFQRSLICGRQERRAAYLLVDDPIPVDGRGLRHGVQVGRAGHRWHRCYRLHGLGLKEKILAFKIPEAIRNWAGTNLNIVLANNQVRITVTEVGCQIRAGYIALPVRITVGESCTGT